MVIDWKRIGKSAGNLFLLFLENCIKLSAVVVTAVVLAAGGSFGSKLGTGFSSISPALRTLFESPWEMMGAANIIHEYNTLPASVFNEQYGTDAIHGVMAYLDGGIIYFYTVYQNFAGQPFSTFFAAVIAFCSLYLISLVLRFARQKGQGSYLNKLERKLADRIFETSRRLNNPQPEPKSKPELAPKPEKKGNKLFDNKSGKINRHLQDYMRSAQSG